MVQPLRMAGSSRALQSRRPLALAGLLALISALPQPAAAQTVPAVEAGVSGHAAEVLKRKLEREAELAALSRDIELSSGRQQEIEQEIASLDRDSESLTNSILSTAGRIKGLEGNIADTERRLERLTANEDTVRASLWQRRGTLAEILASLQRIGRRPPPALVVQPSDALSAVRSAILLNAVMPGLRIEAEALASDLEELNRLKSGIVAEKDKLRADATRLAEEKSRLELLMAAKRQERERSTLQRRLDLSRN